MRGSLSRVADSCLPDVTDRRGDPSQEAVRKPLICSHKQWQGSQSHQSVSEQVQECRDSVVRARRARYVEASLTGVMCILAVVTKRSVRESVEV